MRNLLAKFSLVTMMFCILTGTAYSQRTGNHPLVEAPGVAIGDYFGNEDGGSDGLINFRCSEPTDFIREIKFHRYRGSRDADYYTFDVLCRNHTAYSTNPDDYDGYVHESGSLVSQYPEVVHCEGEPIRGLYVSRYRKSSGDYDTYKFAAKCLATTSGNGYTQGFVGSTRGVSQPPQAPYITECSEGVNGINGVMKTLQIQRYRQSRGDLDTYTFNIGCGLIQF